MVYGEPQTVMKGLKMNGCKYIVVADGREILVNHVVQATGSFVCVNRSVVNQETGKLGAAYNECFSKG